MTIKYLVCVKGDKQQINTKVVDGERILEFPVYFDDDEDIKHNLKKKLNRANKFVMGFKLTLE